MQLRQTIQYMYFVDCKTSFDLQSWQGIFMVTYLGQVTDFFSVQVW